MLETEPEFLVRVLTGFGWEVTIWLSRSNLLDIGPPRWTGATKAEGKGDGKDREGPS